MNAGIHHFSRYLSKNWSCYPKLARQRTVRKAKLKNTHEFPLFSPRAKLLPRAFFQSSHLRFCCNTAAKKAHIKITHQVIMEALQLGIIACYRSRKVVRQKRGLVPQQEQRIRQCCKSPKLRNSETPTSKNGNPS